MGFALPDDALHAPNERAHLPTLARGVQACVRFAAEAARLLVPHSAAVWRVRREMSEALMPP